MNPSFTLSLSRRCEKARSGKVLKVLVHHRCPKNCPGGCPTDLRTIALKALGL